MTGFKFPFDNALVVAVSDKNYLPLLLLIIATIYVVYIITFLEVQNIRIKKLKEIIRLIEEGHAKKVRGGQYKAVKKVKR